MTQPLNLSPDSLRHFFDVQHRNSLTIDRHDDVTAPQTGVASGATGAQTTNAHGEGSVHCEAVSTTAMLQRNLNKTKQQKKTV